ncbi:hypothetical protein ARALYDRAFT_910698 [Arabidopsis lyrata subsp. lyrata]|uniref:Uncharacterized protein n=1 Tax=Arabidopsis lyrata subsp. lyrata TaxID=81972 RepID=D7M4Q8_ARALL|nr:hypothetical protein ARALYDRAFT_910698 [Arabidopsis lyrata subsp. lyrata]
MDTLDFNIALDIATRVGESSFTDLGGMLSTSKFFNKLVYNPAVLSRVSLLPFLSNANLINVDSPFRHFFYHCLQAKNPNACYLESLRLAAKDGLAEVGLDLVGRIGSFPPHALFTKGLLTLCFGDFASAISIIDNFVETVGSFREADAVASQVFRHIMQIGPVKIRSHADTWNYVQFPHCLHTGCRIDKRCRRCFFYWFSVMYLLLC